MSPTAAAELERVPVADRRAAPRLRVAYRVQVRCGADSFVAYSVDVSASGMFLETRATLEPGCAVHLSFTAVSSDLRETVEVDARVARFVTVEAARRHGGLPGVGVVFSRFLWGGDAFAEALGQRLQEERPSASPGANLRRAPRVAVGIPVYWGHQGRDRRAGQLTNLSEGGGFFVESQVTVPPGARLHLWFEVPVAGALRPIRAVASVRRVVEAGAGIAGMAVSIETSPLDAASLRAFLDHRLPGCALGERLARERESSHPTKIDELFHEAAADWEMRGIAAAGGKGETAPAPRTEPMAAGRPVLAAAGAGREPNRPQRWAPALRLAIKVSAALAATLLLVFVTVVLRLV